MPPQTAWWHAYYYQHPHRNSNDPTLFAQSKVGNSGKYKEYCRQCFDQHVLLIHQEIQFADSAGQPTMLPRSQQGISNHLWSIKASTDVADSRGYRTSHPSTLVNHLARCKLQPPIVQENALSDKNCTLTRSGPNRRGPAAGPSLSGATPLHRSVSLPSGLSGLGLILSGAQPSSSDGGSVPLSPLVMQTPHLAPMSSASVASPLLPSDSISNVSYSGYPHPPNTAPAAPQMTPFMEQSRRPSLAFQHDHWPPDKQARFENRLARITTSAGLPLSWVDNPEWIGFVKEFLHPNAKSPSRKTMTTRIIPNLVEKLRSEARAQSKGKNATIQSDGWTGENHRHLIAFMITADKRVFTVRVDDVSADRKTAPNLLVLLEKAIEDVEKSWGANVVAVVTDASGECRRAKKDLEAKYPWIIVLDCYAHQINLVVGDYFADKSPVLATTDSAADLITWMRSKKIVLALLRKAQEDASAPLLNVLRAVLTRWTSHFRAYERLLLIQNHLRAIVYADEAKPAANKKIVAGEASARNKATAMCNVIKDNEFWTALARVVRHLRPLAAAANILQSAFCRLDTVVLTFGYLTALYAEMQDPDDRIGAQAIMASLEKRWAASNQEIFIAAIILNPFYRREPFAAIPEFNNATINFLIGRVYRRLFRTEVVPNELDSQLQHYLQGTGQFVFTFQAQLALETRNAAQENRDIDPNKVFDQYAYGNTDIILFQLARRVLSITANSASCERLFSAFGILSSKHRNRTTLPTLLNQVELKARVRDEHLDQQKQKELRERLLAQANQYSVENQPNLASLEAEVVPLPSAEPAILHSSNLIQSSSIPRAITTQSSSQRPSSSPAVNTQPSPSSDSPAVDTFRNLINQHISQSSIAFDFDSEEEEPEAEGPLNRPPRQGFPKIPLSQLFDFQKDYWKNLVSEKLNRSFAEELELFQMLDLDADGNDIGADVDDITADILSR